MYRGSVSDRFAMSHPRVCLQRAVQQLKETCGPEKGQQYWDALRRFLLAKLSKREFDFIVRDRLGVENLHLHNSLIKAILVNAQSGQPAPSAPLNIFTRTEHARRPRIRSAQLKKKELEKLKHKRKHKHRELPVDADPPTPKDTSPQLAERTKEPKRKRRVASDKNEFPVARDDHVEERKKDPVNKRSRVAPKTHGAAANAPPRSPVWHASRTTGTPSLRPRHSYSGMPEVEPTEISYEVRQHAQGIGMNVTQDSIDYMRYAVHEYLNRIVDACRIARAEHPEQEGEAISLLDLRRAMLELDGIIPPWIMAKLDLALSAGQTSGLSFDSDSPLLNQCA